MQNGNINTDQPIISLTVNFTEVNLSINEQHISALLQSGDFDNEIRARIDALQALFEETYVKVRDAYANLLAEIYLDVSANEIAPRSRNTVFFIENSEEDTEYED